jgi:hypothetical protein
MQICQVCLQNILNRCNETNLDMLGVSYSGNEPSIATGKLARLKTDTTSILMTFLTPKVKQIPIVSTLS